YESIDRSYVFNGFNDHKFTVASALDWDNRAEVAAIPVPRDVLVKPAATAVFGEKKSGPTYAHRFYVDLFESPARPLDVLTHNRHDGGGNHAFADGSAKLIEPFGSLAPENLWGLRESTRRELTYSANQGDQDGFF
ncbi:MAG: H-X9-DG-CTERM domain-containing protein, partial [Planctomycetota bacterium]